jgi:hypothetical protein
MRVGEVSYFAQEAEGLFGDEGLFGFGQSDTLMLVITSGGKPLANAAIIVPAIGAEAVGMTDKEGKVTIPVPEGQGSGVGFPITVRDLDNNRDIDTTAMVTEPGVPYSIDLPAPPPVAAPAPAAAPVKKEGVPVAAYVGGAIVLGILGFVLFKK